ncbi:hypothetical protein VNO78_08273 [Psophocarpus tetragonolobus]|uniref:Uncharacterized protein n=1 Tax=Psophocarpus tetragonolobus TaxID=3891 RepID=A0AAN9XT83_PSOTE
MAYGQNLFLRFGELPSKQPRVFGSVDRQATIDTQLIKPVIGAPSRGIPSSVPRLERDRFLVLQPQHPCTSLDTSKVVPPNHFSPTHAAPFFIMGFCVARVEPTEPSLDGPHSPHFLLCPYLCPFQLNITSRCREGPLAFGMSHVGKSSPQNWTVVSVIQLQRYTVRKLFVNQQVMCLP